MINDIIESNTYNYLNFQTLNYINSKDFEQPYTNDKPSLQNIDSVYDYNLRNKANEVSCEHQTILNNFNDVYYDNNYVLNKSYVNYMKPVDYDYQKDLYMLLGRQVTPKSCDVKKDKYNEGIWVNYHNDNVKKNIDSKIFNIHTKSKLQ
tara:strand:+ start:1381 stop:1827 length:447 start_codon:yes stop_codon:yes gene_type:complete